jgi:hypothetical protein
MHAYQKGPFLASAVMWMCVYVSSFCMCELSCWPVNCAVGLNMTRVACAPVTQKFEVLFRRLADYYSVYSGLLHRIRFLYQYSLYCYMLVCIIRYKKMKLSERRL